MKQVCLSLIEYKKQREIKVLFDEFQKYAVNNIISFFSNRIRRQFEIYFHELIEWNKILNLIHYKNERDLIYRHFCDSLYSAKIIDSILTKQNMNSKNVKIADLGTGSGMPGIPVKIALPDVVITLIESITKKCKFLDNINTKLRFDMEILNKRAEEVGQMPLYKQKYDFVLSRAVSKFSASLELSIPLLKVNGYFMVYKTKHSLLIPEEGLGSIKNALKHLGAKFEKVVFYHLPSKELDYCILVFKKHKDTPLQFPRKPGIPEKKPL
ncbi:MAG: 16S rRNA (guanine(527)-N(7))-methyltransferase RsmG [Endomicrobium sp.]|jgi:16S rRNA (guanine527-N7)-methyltransferase|nr:16S rRNA (guanine(527)-N(7))-methyltransferase RsmG [Endomicrobium sp.]